MWKPYRHTKKVINAGDDDAWTWHSLGISLYLLGRDEEAIQAYRRSILLEPDQDISHMNLGVSLGKLKQFDEAISELQTAVRLDPDDPNTHYNLADIYDDAGRHDDAIAEYRKAIQINPDNRSTGVTWEPLSPSLGIRKMR